MKHLFCDCKTDEEKANFFLSGRAVETGIIAPAISNDVAMAYHRCAELQKETDTLRAKIEAMEKQEPVKYERRIKRRSDHTWGHWRECYKIDYVKAKATGGYYPKFSDDLFDYEMRPLYALPGAQPAPSVPEVTDAMIEAIESRAEQSYRRHHGGARGQQIVPADALSWHIIHATRKVLSEALEAKP